LTELSDQALCARLGQGDRTALRELHARHAGAVFALALRLLRSRAEAEDVVQETFIEAWRRADRYQPARAAVAAWLATIAKSRAIDRLRRTDALTRATDGLSAPEAPSSPEGEVDDARNRQRLAQAVELLPSTAREVLDLAWREGLSQSEIAARTGLPLGTVKTRTRLALLNLAKSLRPND
jgi:RNA polymerase sigma-70 factor, ECF subfamily